MFSYFSRIYESVQRSYFKYMHGFGFHSKLQQHHHTQFYLMYWKVKNSTHYRGMSVCYVPLYRKWPPLLVIFLQLNYVWGYDFFSFLKWCCISVLLCGIMAILCNVLQRLHIFNLDHIGICNHMIFYILTPFCHCWWNRCMLHYFVTLEYLECYHELL